MMAHHNSQDNVLKIGFMNIRGQTGLTSTKQLQIESFIIREKLDVLNLQEINIIEESFASCNTISSSFNIISNNAANKYGTASIIKSDFSPSNVVFDTNGRAIIFDIGNISIGNVYFPSGSDSISKNARENYSSVTLPQLLLNKQDSGCLGGDFNCILNKQDCTYQASSKISPSLAKLVHTFDMKDSFRILHPKSTTYSYFYHTQQQGEGATRIDRSYNWGELRVSDARYEPIAFSDHLAYVVSFSLPEPMARILSPRSRPLFKIGPTVIKDHIFQARLSESMTDWQEVHDLGLDIITWWELLVKPGIRKLAIQRSKEINRERRGELNLLFLRQAYLMRRIQLGNLVKLGEFRSVQEEIQLWYEKESKRVILQARAEDINLNEKVRIYHHDIHKKNIKKAAILKLQTERGLLQGHAECANYLEDQVADLLLHPAPLHQGARDCLLAEVQQVFSEEDNKKFLRIPDEKEVREVLNSSNLLAAPGTDGIPFLLYHECWQILKGSCTKVIQAIFQGNRLPLSMRTSVMVFGSKPKKPHSLKPGDKRRISLLNSDFKLASGIEAKRFGNTATYSLSPLQLVAGDDRRIHHGINRARDAIQKVSKTKVGCGLLDLDFMAGFDWLDMAWVYLVLSKKGVSDKVIQRIKNLYNDSVSVVMVNNIQGRVFPNIRGSLRQGDKPSMFWFSVGIDPLLNYLEKRLQGILISSIPVHGPTLPNQNSPVLDPMKEEYKVQAYADDVKPAITTMEEFDIVDEACTLLEKASGVKLHRDPATEKVKFLPLGRWQGTLTQEDIPHHYMRLSDHLDFVGVELRSTFSQTRRVNGELLQNRIKNIVGPWKAGRFMDLSQRAFSANCYGLSKVWFKCSVINLRMQDQTSITSQVKSWLYQDLLVKPAELVLYRPITHGGLGLMNVGVRSLALLIRTFLETSINPNFRHSLFHEHLFRYHVMGEHSLPDPGYTPYYNRDFFQTICYFRDTSCLNIASLSIKQWYRLLLEDKILMKAATEEAPTALLPLRCEELHPNNDWEQVWANLRMKGLGSELVSFQLKLLHNLLPTQERIARAGLHEGDPGLCLHCRLEREDQLHAVFGCRKNLLVGLALLGCVQQLLPDLTPEAAVLLDLGITLHGETLLAALVILTTGLKYIWEARVAKKTVVTHQMRAEMEAKVTIMRKSRHKTAADMMGNLIQIIQ